MPTPTQQQYSDLPPGAVGVASPHPYNDLPPGAVGVAPQQASATASAPHGLFDTIASNFRANTTQRPSDGTIGTALQNFGGRVATNLSGMVAHPLDTIAGTVEGARQVLAGDPNNPLSNRVAQFKQDWSKDKGLAVENALGDAGTALLTDGLTKGVPARLGPIPVGDLPSVIGRGMQAKGVGIINSTVGALKGDFARGANPGQGYFQAGLGPSVSMGSIAAKAGDARSAVGAGLEPKYLAADATGIRLPAAELAQTLQEPITAQRNIITGPGGTGNVGQLEDYAASFRPTLQDAAQNGGIKPSDLWAVKRNIAANTNWKDATQYDLNDVRQNTAGALSGKLNEAVPGLAADNNAYQNLTKLESRADYRDNTGISPLSGIARKAVLGAVGGASGLATHGFGGALTGLAAVGLDSVPVKTGLASGLYYGGGALPIAMPNLFSTAGAASPALVLGRTKRQQPTAVNESQ